MGDIACEKDSSLQELISVIIPVYKVEKYLNQCIESVVAQSYRNLEIILVDDGSPDRCPEICDMWAKKDARVRVIHKKNGGVSDARNVGLDESRGEYVLFVDSDDLIAPELVEELYLCCKENNVKLSMCSILDFSGEKSLQKQTHGRVSVLSARYVCEHFFDFGASSLCAKIYHCSLIKNVRLVLNRRIGEDATFNFPLFYGQKMVSYVHKPMYFYRRYAESTTGSYNVHFFDELLTFDDILSFCKKNGDERIFNSMVVEYYARILAHENNVKKCCNSNEDVLNELKLKKKNLFRMVSSITLKLKLYVAGLAPRVFLKLFFMLCRLHLKQLRK